MTENGLLRPSAERDIDCLMRWFGDARAVRVWGGPHFRFPYTRHSFAEDMHWGRMAAFSLALADEDLVGFGQVYERFGRINLARLVVQPGRRGQGMGRQLVSALMRESRKLFSLGEYALFVYRDNQPALRCYQSLGFEFSDYPDGMPLADDCYYLVRSVAAPATGTA
ncbi:MAG: GNAT family N-acetyltransferase [Gammaproteobacteria bacterium]|nr:GNAT family N-acetyltransferase [Gammaproteobacteria bacterium]